MKNLISSLLLVLIFSNQSLAEETKSKTSNRQKEVTDPDLSLSIEELKKKYPISLLDEKKKNYKPGQKINIDDYSIEEIKAAFLNADGNFVLKVPSSEIPEIAPGKVDVNLLDNNVKAHSQLELDIIHESCERTGYAILEEPEKYRVLQSFLFSSEKIQKFFLRFVPNKTWSCFSGSDPFELEDRN